MTFWLSLVRLQFPCVCRLVPMLLCEHSYVLATHIPLQVYFQGYVQSYWLVTVFLFANMKTLELENFGLHSAKHNTAALIQKERIPCNLFLHPILRPLSPTVGSSQQWQIAIIKGNSTHKESFHRVRSVKCLWPLPLLCFLQEIISF